MFEFLKPKKPTEPRKEGGKLVVAPDQHGVPKGFVRMRHHYPDGSMSRNSINIPGAGYWDPILALKERIETEDRMRNVDYHAEAAALGEQALRRAGYDRVGNIARGSGDGI